MPLGDNIDPKDEVLTRLSQAPAAEELPRIMLCPSGHQASRQVFEHGHIVAVGAEGEAVSDTGPTKQIPFYVCASCVVVYRYQECTLVPGDEGRP